MDQSEHDVLAYMGFPAQHRTRLHSTNPLERLNKEVKRRADVVGVFPGEPSIIRLIGAVLLGINDDWVVQNRYTPIEGMAELAAMPAGDDVIAIPPMAASSMTAQARQRIYTTTSDAIHPETGRHQIPRRRIANFGMGQTLEWGKLWNGVAPMAAERLQGGPFRRRRATVELDGPPRSVRVGAER